MREEKKEHREERETGMHRKSRFQKTCWLVRNEEREQRENVERRQRRQRRQMKTSEASAWRSNDYTPVLRN